MGLRASSETVQIRQMVPRWEMCAALPGYRSKSGRNDLSIPLSHHTTLLQAFAQCGSISETEQGTSQGKVILLLALPGCSNPKRRVMLWARLKATKGGDVIHQPFSGQSVHGLHLQAPASEPSRVRSEPEPTISLHNCLRKSAVSESHTICNSCRPGRASHGCS